MAHYAKQYQSALTSVVIVSTRGKKRIVLGSKIGSGGEGTVYSVDNDNALCIKIYHEQKRTPALEQKLKAMIEAPPKDPTQSAGHYSICWPTHLVYEDEACTKFLGFAMPMIDKKMFKEYHLLCDKPGASSSACYRLEHFGMGFTYLHMYAALLNLASCVSSIHEAGHAIGDLNDKNILVSTKDSKISIVDCDSFEIHGKDNSVFPCSVYMPEFSAPEVIKHESIKDRQESDRFALAILIFKLLMLNTHPFSSRGTAVEHLNTPGEKIAAGYYPYEEHAGIDVEAPSYALPYDIIPPNIKELFRRCFVDGQHDPDKRPTAVEWMIALQENFNQMNAALKGKKHPCDANYNHMFPQHLQQCPWCEMPEDYFPEPFDRELEISKDDEQFKYIEKMLREFALDRKISLEEYDKIADYSRQNLISEEKLLNVLKKIHGKNRRLSFGDGLKLINPLKRVNLKIEGATIKRKEVKISNEYLYDTIEVDILSLNPDIRIETSPIKLNPGEKATVVFEINTHSLELKILKRLTTTVEFLVKTGSGEHYKVLMPFEIELHSREERKQNFFSKLFAFGKKIITTHYLDLVTYLIFILFFGINSMFDRSIAHIVFSVVTGISILANLSSNFYKEFFKLLNSLDRAGIFVFALFIGPIIGVSGLLGMLTKTFWGSLLGVIPFSILYARLFRIPKNKPSLDSEVKNGWVWYGIITFLLLAILIITMINPNGLGR